MRGNILHHHSCQQCGAKTECTGQLEQNYDGEPEWICVEFHMPEGTINSDFICADCEAKNEEEAKQNA